MCEEYRCKTAGGGGRKGEFCVAVGPEPQAYWMKLFKDAGR